MKKVHAAYTRAIIFLKIGLRAHFRPLVLGSSRDEKVHAAYTRAIIFLKIGIRALILMIAFWDILVEMVVSRANWLGKNWVDNNTINKH